MNIRTATSLDQDAIRYIHWTAFTKDERAEVSALAVNLLLAKTSPKIISLVAEFEKTIVGHVAFSPITIETDENFTGFILTPLGVMPDYQKRGVGTKLVESGIQQLSDKGVNILFVYGDPKYYGRFGFSADAAERYLPPYKLKYPYGWQAVALNEGAARENEASKTSAEVAFVSALSDPALW